jgi:hypothetical protein
MEQHWKKISFERAADLIEACELQDESLAMLSPGMRPEDYILTLSESGHWSDAAMAMAFALPRREAVWWACMCAQDTEIMTSDESERLALQVAEKWVYQPTADHRAQAFIAAQESKSNDCGALCALAVALTEDTLPLGPDQTIEVDSSGFPGLVFGIVVTAAGDGNGSLFDERLRKSLLRGQEIACGGNGKLEETQTTPIE